MTVRRLTKEGGVFCLLFHVAPFCYAQDDTPFRDRPRDTGTRTQTLLDAEQLDQAISLELTLVGFHLDPLPAAVDRPATSANYLRAFQSKPEEPTENSGRAQPRLGSLSGTLEFTFEDENVVRIRVELHAPQVRRAIARTRTIDAAPLPPEAISRTLSVVVSEFIRSTKHELVLQQEESERQRLFEEKAQLERQAREQDKAREQLQARLEQRAEEPTYRVGEVQLALGALLAVASAQTPALLGGELGFSHRVHRSFRWSAEVGGQWGKSEVRLGRVDFGRLSVSAGGDLPLWFAPGLYVGPRVGASVFWAKGVVTGGGFEEQVQQGFSFTTTLRLGFETKAAEHLVLRSTVDLGPVLRPMTFTAGGRPLFRFAGLYAAWTVGGAFRL